MVNSAAVISPSSSLPVQVSVTVYGTVPVAGSTVRFTQTGFVLLAGVVGVGVDVGPGVPVGVTVGVGVGVGVTGQYHPPGGRGAGTPILAHSGNSSPFKHGGLGAQVGVGVLVPRVNTILQLISVAFGVT